MQVGERALIHDAAGADDGDARAELLDLGEQMAGEEDGHAPAGQLLDQVAHVADAARVEAVRRLVEYEQLRVAQERGGEPESLPHSLRVAADLVARPAPQTDRLEHVADAFAGVAAVEGREQLEVRAPGEVRVEVRRLHESGHPVERGWKLVLGVAPEQPDLSRVRPQQPEHHAHRGRLAGAVGPRKP